MCVSSALGHPIHRYYTTHLGFVKPKNDRGVPFIAGPDA